LHPNLENPDINKETECVGTYTPDIEIPDGKKARLPTEAEINHGFEQFWRVYPKRTSYGGAEKEFRRVVRAGKVSIERLVQAAKVYAAARDEAKQHHFDIAPARWLRDECWNDDPASHSLGMAPTEPQPIQPEIRNYAEMIATRAAQAEPPAPDPRWTRVCAALATQLGDEVCKRYFSETEFEEIANGAVRLRTPAPYDARRIMNDYAEVLLKHWKEEDASVRSVAVLYGKRPASLGHDDREGGRAAVAATDCLRSSRSRWTNQPSTSLNRPSPGLSTTVKVASDTSPTDREARGRDPQASPRSLGRRAIAELARRGCIAQLPVATYGR
jgi:hypothetical protein